MKTMKPILVVDDDPQMRDALKEAIQRLGFEATVAENGQDGLAKMANTPFALIITDMKMPRMDGLAFLKEVRRRVGNLPVLVITGYGTVENAVDSMKEGATDYLMKPFSFDKLGSKISSIMETMSSDRDIITGNPKMTRLLQISRDVAAGDTTVLVYGESGTGKELIARYIHSQSLRKLKPFVAVNCAAIPENLMESELFGHEKGSFTGASDKKLGKFELANEGTILLDEIGEMPMGLQAKLLRVLQEREIDRIGGKHTIPINTRVLATTNRDLRKEAEAGNFREDLYYRLSVFPLHVPPLRERPEDIALLSDYFIRKFSALLNKEAKRLSDSALNFLLRNQWRGNIRELENTVHRAVLLSRNQEIDISDFMLEEQPSARRVDLSPDNNKRGIKEMERDLIMKTLKDVNGNKTKAAKILGVNVRTIRNKLSEYGKFFPDEQ
ncbi:sigma-54-dependent Fis family transcriptional regulator [Candidatus Magnetominusculus xianensis]|uniref:Sigma-54-dependent Fis family transcriptional regulator n=2 Tax=Candidatus Magnetominusculus xianensis TaxID=1748249 RepID=A0ABR5SH09_9BACT|nr:sigma-54-dependent Fis family transcriptional regulator [Candidatus Magnetominusculus xianensis]